MTAAYLKARPSVSAHTARSNGAGILDAQRLIHAIRTGTARPSETLAVVQAAAVDPERLRALCAHLQRALEGKA